MDEAYWLGKRVFAFAPHASHAIVSTEDALEIPDDISTYDATFLPNVETALSLAMAARPLIAAERVLVVGQGVVGLLLAAVLATRFDSRDITVVNVKTKRLALARAFLRACCSFIDPSLQTHHHDDADVTVEVRSLDITAACKQPFGTLDAAVVSSWGLYTVNSLQPSN